MTTQFHAVVRASARATALATTALLVCVMAGCSGDVEDPISADLDRAQLGLATDFATLMDSDGFIANPDGGTERPLDVYATAWLLSMSDSIGDETSVPPLDPTAVAEATGLAVELGIPDVWLAWAWMVLADHGAGTFGDARDALMNEDLYDAGAPVEDRAVALWVAALMEHREEGSASYPGDLAADVRRVIKAPGLSVTTAWVLWEACEVLEASCEPPAPSWERPATLDPQAILDWASSAELQAVGVEVSGYAPTPDLAARELSGLPAGNDLIADQLTRILVLEGASPEPARGYWERAVDRRDTRTGLFRQFVEMRGTIETTYEARAALGSRFDDLIEGSPARDSLREILDSRSAELSAPTLAKAVALMTPWGETPSRENSDILDGLQSNCGGTVVSMTQGSDCLELLFVVTGLGLETAKLSATPAPVDDTTERYALKILQAAYSDLLTNGDEVISYYATYITDLPSRIVADGAESPLFIARLGVLDYLDVELDDTWWTTVEDYVAALKGCEGLPHMIARDAARTSGCDVNLSAAVINTGVGIRVLGADRD